MRISKSNLMVAAALAVAALLSSGSPAVADEHLVPLAAAEERLADSAGQRAQDLAALQPLLTTPEAAAAVSALSDAELRDLAHRAQALEADPVAGAMTQREWLLIGVGAAAVLVLILLLD